MDPQTILSIREAVRFQKATGESIRLSADDAERLLECAEALQDAIGRVSVMEEAVRVAAAWKTAREAFVAHGGPPPEDLAARLVLFEALLGELVELEPQFKTDYVGGRVRAIARRAAPYFKPKGEK
jgi:hypothetical protein